MCNPKRGRIRMGQKTYIFEEIMTGIFKNLILKTKTKSYIDLQIPEISKLQCFRSHYTCYNFTVYVNESDNY